MFCSSHTFAVTSGFFSYFESTKTLTCSFSSGAKMLQYRPSFLRALTQNPKAMFMLTLKHQSKISKNENYNTGLHWCSLENCAVGPSHERIQRNLIERILKTMRVTCCATFQLGLFDRICTCTLTHLVSVVLTGIWQRCMLCVFVSVMGKQSNTIRVRSPTILELIGKSHISNSSKKHTFPEQKLSEHGMYWSLEVWHWWFDDLSLSEQVAFLYNKMSFDDWLAH